MIHQHLGMCTLPHSSAKLKVCNSLVKNEQNTQFRHLVLVIKERTFYMYIYESWLLSRGEGMSAPPPQMNPAEPIVNMLLRGQRDPKYVDPVGQGVLSYSILEQLL